MSLEHVCNAIIDEFTVEQLENVVSFATQRLRALKFEEDTSIKKVVELGKVWGERINNIIRDSPPTSSCWIIESDDMNHDIRSAIVQFYRKKGYKALSETSADSSRAWVKIELVFSPDAFIEGMKSAK